MVDLTPKTEKLDWYIDMQARRHKAMYEKLLRFLERELRSLGMLTFEHISDIRQGNPVDVENLLMTYTERFRFFINQIEYRDENLERPYWRDWIESSEEDREQE